MRGEYTLTDVVLLYIDWDLGGEYMSEGKQKGPRPFFHILCVLSLDPHNHAG